MPTRVSHSCARREATVALARKEPHGEQRQQAEMHLTHCEACRTLFRHETARRLPRIRNYTIVSELGRGGFGIVYKAVSHSKQRYEALKVLFGKTAQREAYFENEVRLVARLGHPNIATLFDAHLSTPPLYYAMELVEGRHLDDYFRAGQVSLEQRIELVKAVAAAIGYAHGQGVMHRDLKPQNILIDPRGQPRIVDFGIAKRLVRPHESGSEGAGAAARPEGALGTYGYIAPEQLAGQEVDSRADVYGLGALLFHVITGQPARFAPQVERLTEVLHEGRVSRADDLAAIIACCVRPDPDQRYASCAALVEDLDNYLAGRPIRARADESPGYRVARISALVLRNYPRSVQTAATCLVALLLAVAFWLAGTRFTVSGQSGIRTALIAVTPDTLAAINAGQFAEQVPGLVPAQRKSWRLLYGRLMEKLAAADTQAVVWDYFFPDRQPAYDAGFIAGVRALGRPVVVGSKWVDVNGEPQLCPDIRQAVHAWGCVFGIRPEDLKNAIAAPLALKRGFNPAVPSLALSGFAAARRPDCDLDIDVRPDALQLRYRKRAVAEGERRWHDETDTISIFETDSGGGRQTGLANRDEMLIARFQSRPVGEWKQRAIPLEAVFAATPEQLREWFGGRAVLVGQMLPGLDQHRLKSGEWVHGCQIQAVVLDSLSRRAIVQRVDRVGLAARVAVWCVLAAVLANLVPIRGIWSVRGAGLLTVILVGIALVAAVNAAQFATTSWTKEATIALCSLLAGGATTLGVKLLHERQLRLTPGLSWSARTRGRASTTLVASSAGSTPS